MSNEQDKKRLRSYLNSTIRGQNTDAILEALSTGVQHLRENTEAIHDMLYITKAVGRYLDARLSDSNITRPDLVGLSDEVFREIGIEIKNRKQVRDLILNILRIIYGEDYTRATMDASELEPYLLEDGDTLIIQYDDTDPVEIVFSSQDFTNIGNATAQEISDVITKQINNLGANGAAFSNDDGLGNCVRLISEVDGPVSSVKILGGKAQNKLRFPSIRPTSAQITTEWTLEPKDGGVVRATWTGGPNPSIGKVRKGNYVNIYGSAFSPINRGTFTVTAVQGGDLGNAYVEFDNPLGIAEVVLQGDLEGMLFYSIEKTTILSKLTYASMYHTQDNLLEIFMPATTRVIRRDRIGAAHLPDAGVPATEGNEGPYLFDETKPYVIGSEQCLTTSNIDLADSSIIQVDNASDFPDAEGQLIFGFGTEKEEGPIPYIARPSGTSIIIDPSYKFQQTHGVGTDISLVASNLAMEVASDGTDYAVYLTDTVSGRLYAEELIDLVVASGIRVAITILYPNPIGLENWNKDDPEAQEAWKAIWGPDLT